RAKWRSCSSAWGSVVATCLTPPTFVRDACYGSERKRLFSTVILNGGIIGARRCMTREKKTGWRRSVLRIGTAMQAILYAVLVTGIVWRYKPTLPYGALALILVGLCIAFYFHMFWVFVDRRAVLAE